MPVEYPWPHGGDLMDPAPPNGSLRCMLRMSSTRNTRNAGVTGNTGNMGIAT